MGRLPGRLRPCYDDLQPLNCWSARGLAEAARRAGGRGRGDAEHRNR